LIQVLRQEFIDLARLKAGELKIERKSIEFGNFEFQQLRIPVGFLVAAVNP